MKKQSGFTLVELMIGVVIILVIIEVVVTSTRGCGAGDQNDLKEQARAYANDLGYAIIGVSCMSHDSDGDGYISCTVRFEESSGGDKNPPLRVRRRVSKLQNWLPVGGQPNPNQVRANHVW